MGEATTEIVSRLRLDRDSWASDLQGAKSQTTEFVQSLNQQRITIPLAVDLTEAAARLQAFRVEQESRPIRIPVEMVPAGMGAVSAADMLAQPVTGGGWGGRMGALMAGGGGGLLGGGAGGAGGGGPIYNNVYNTANTLNTVNTANNVVNQGAAAGGGDAQSRWGGGIRGLMLLHLGMTGAGDAIDAVSDRMTFDRMDAERGDPLTNEKRTIQMLKQEQSLFYGIPSRIRDIGEWASGNKTTGRMIEDMENDVRTQERRISFDTRIRERDRAVTEQADIEEMPEGFGRRLAEIQKHTKDLKEGFRKEAAELNELAAATKDAAQAQELRREARKVVERGDVLADRIGDAETARARVLEGREVAAIDARTTAQRFENDRMPNMARLTEFQSHLQEELDAAEGDPAKQAAIRRLGAAQIQGILNPPMRTQQTTMRSVYMGAIEAALKGGTNDWQRARVGFQGLLNNLNAGGHAAPMGDATHPPAVHAAAAAAAANAHAAAATHYDKDPRIKALQQNPTVDITLENDTYVDSTGHRRKYDASHPNPYAPAMTPSRIHDYLDAHPLPDSGLKFSGDPRGYLRQGVYQQHQRIAQAAANSQISDILAGLGNAGAAMMHGAAGFAGGMGGGGAPGAANEFGNAVRDFKDAADAIKNAQPLYVAK